MIVNVVVPVVEPALTVINCATPSTLNVNVSFAVGAVSNVTVYVTVALFSVPTIADVNIAFVLSIVSVTITVPVAELSTLANPPPVVEDTLRL